MKAYCCEQRLATITEDVAYFTKRCGVCGMTYTQNKRQPEKLVTQSKPFDADIGKLQRRATVLEGFCEGLKMRLDVQNAHVENLIDRVSDLEGWHERDD